MGISIVVEMFEYFRPMTYNLKARIIPFMMVSLFFSKRFLGQDVGSDCIIS